MKAIPLTKGKVGIVDDADFDLVNQFKWFARYYKKNGRWEAFRRIWGSKKLPTKYISMSAHIMGRKEGYTIDHWNHDTLDCQRENLRWATKTQQVQNRQGWGRHAKGVFKVTEPYRSRRPYRAMIRVEKKLIYLGYFATEEEASAAYKQAAVKYFGEFSYTK